MPTEEPPSPISDLYASLPVTRLFDESNERFQQAENGMERDLDQLTV